MPRTCSIATIPRAKTPIMQYVKDMGLNMLRWESKISSEHIVDLADQAGIPLMFGWMCCNQWEKWEQWDAEDQTVARKSLRSQILMLRSHPAVFVWANGSDGRPPPPVLQDYHRILEDLHWQNATVGYGFLLRQRQHGQPLVERHHHGGAV